MPARDVPCEVDVTSKSYVSEVCLTLRYGLLCTSFCDFMSKRDDFF